MKTPEYPEGGLLFSCVASKYTSSVQMSAPWARWDTKFWDIWDARMMFGFHHIVKAGVAVDGCGLGHWAFRV